MRFYAALLALMMSLPAVAQDMATRTDEYLTAWANTGRFQGTVLIAQDGKVVLRKGYGMANLELGVPNSPEMVYRIGSVTKTFTAFGILQLEEKGKLNVKDPVVKYVPEMPKAWQAITIHQLLTHTSGIPNFSVSKDYAKADDPLRVEKGLAEFASKPLDSAPGEKFAYSNSGYILLGRIIEKVSGVSYEQYIDANILKPAGLVNTGYDHARPILKNRASGYQFDGEGLANAGMIDMSGAHSAGALHSTVDDLYRFDQAIDGGKLFSKALLEEAWKPQAKFWAPPPFMMDAMYCYGWMSGQDFGHPYLNHGGWVDGFITQYWRYPQDKMTVILISNVEAPHIITLEEGLIAAIFGKPYQLPKKHTRVEVSHEVLKRYVGTYHAAPGLDLELTVEGPNLFVQGTGRPRFQAIPESDTDFYFVSIESPMHMTVTPEGKVEKLTLKMSGQEIVAPKIK